MNVTLSAKEADFRNEIPEIDAPSSKSHLHRLLFLAALSSETEKRCHILC